MQNNVKYVIILKIIANAVVGKGLEKGLKMSVKPVYLEDVPSSMTLEEVPQEILVKNPRKRMVVIEQQESGWKEKQVFKSECLPDEIPYKLLGLVKFPDRTVYPKYRANVVTDKELCLRGIPGYKNGISIIDKVAWWLTWQKNMLEAKSIKKPDLEFFDYEKEDFSYWLASPGSFNSGSYAHFGPGAVRSGRVFCGSGGTFSSDGYWSTLRVAVRPIMILASEVQNGLPKITWVPL